LEAANCRHIAADCQAPPSRYTNAMRILLPLFAALLGAAGPAPRYANPVIDHDFPDPAVLRASDGFYYAYATQSAGADGKFRNIAAARSRDLVHWSELADALPVKPAWASRTQDFWPKAAIIFIFRPSPMRRSMTTSRACASRLQQHRGRRDRSATAAARYSAAQAM
jgi:hypothetical protein